MGDDYSGMSDFGSGDMGGGVDSYSSGSSMDFGGGQGGQTTYGSGAGTSYGSALSALGSNYGSNLGGLMPSTLGSTGAGVSLGGGRTRKTSRGHYITGGAVYRHSMNPLNPRALRRAISRVTRFETFAKRVLKITSPHHHVAGIKRARRKRRSW